MQVAEASRLGHDCLYTGNSWLPINCQKYLRDKNTMAETYRCPKCQSTQVKHWQFPDWMLVHWVLNPGLAFNELVLGQKVPKLTLVCQACQLPRAERVYIPCPGCNAIHDARIWDKKNAFGNWLGLVCPTCSQRIPSLWNLTSLLVLLLSAPIWYLPYRFYFRDRPVVQQATISTRFTSQTDLFTLLLGLLLLLAVVIGIRSVFFA